jgi:hypothetical protein
MQETGGQRAEQGCQLQVLHLAVHCKSFTWLCSMQDTCVTEVKETRGQRAKQELKLQVLHLAVHHARHPHDAREGRVNTWIAPERMWMEQECGRPGVAVNARLRVMY